MKNILIKGDCLEKMKLIPDRSVDMIFADLPYGTTNCKWDCLIPLNDYMVIDGIVTEKNDFMLLRLISGVSFSNALKEWNDLSQAGLWTHYKRILKPNGVVVLFAQTPFDKVLGASNLKMLRYEWIWEKTAATGHLNAKKMPMKAHENLLVFYKKLPTYNFIKTTGHVRKVSSAQSRNKSIDRRDYSNYLYNQECTSKTTDYDSTERYPRSVLKFASDKQKSNLHPNQKPIALCEYMIKTYANEGDLVLDNTAGSGTTGKACQNLNRNFILIEKDVDFCEIIENRLNLTKEQII